MKIEDVTIATITWARDPRDETLLLESLGSLAALGAALIIADGGSSDRFLTHLEGLPKTKVFRADRPGVVAQSRASLRAASEHDTEFLLYTEPDKRYFFEVVLREFIQAVHADEDLGVSFPSRTPESFATFPATQRCTEEAINALFGREVSLCADFCYGPLLLNRTLLSQLNALGDEVGWGWRFYIMGAARHARLRLRSYEAKLPCPRDQRGDDHDERMHRMRQLQQNIRGVLDFMDATRSPQ